MSAAHLPAITTLRHSAERANAAGQPLVIMTTLTGCPWCDLVRNHYLGPMLAKGEVVAFELDVRDRSRRLQAFDGGFTTHADQARAWKARFAPTVMFWSAQGQELAERLVGVAVPEMYGSYLEQRLAEARGRLR
jgi:thioredoxin-related protein